ncbi:MAG: hypothetical protein IKT32_00570 [Clostridia bacterium]|nr:hypothetical protein [Clostridia bacterium]
MKYAKKIKKHFEYLSNEEHLEKIDCSFSGLKTGARLLQGACCHFFTGENALPLISATAKKLNGVNFSNLLNSHQDKILLQGELLTAFCLYKKTTGFNDCDELIESILSLLTQNLERVLQDDHLDADSLIIKLSSVNAIYEYYEIYGDSLTSSLLDATVLRLQSCDIYSYKSYVAEYLSLCSALLRYAKTTNKTAINELIATLFDNFLVNAQSINYESSKLFLAKTETDASATARSLEVALLLYNNLQDDRYLTIAKRIWFNGMQFCQRFEGHTGTNVFATETTRLRVRNYYNDLATTALYGVGLKHYFLNKAFFEEQGELSKDRRGRYFVGDKMFGFDESGFFGRDLLEIPTLTAFDKETAMQLSFRLVF